MYPAPGGLAGNANGSEALDLRSFCSGGHSNSALTVNRAILGLGERVVIVVMELDNQREKKT